MARPRKRSSGTSVPNLYLEKGKYYRYKHPQTGERYPFGQNKEEAEEAARQLNEKFMNGGELMAIVLAKKAEAKAIRKSKGRKVAEIIDEYIYFPKSKPDKTPKGAFWHHPLSTDTRKIRIAAYKRFKREFGDEYITNVGKKFLGDWLADNTPSNEAYMKNRALLVKLWEYAIAKDDLPENRNEADATMKRSLSDQLEENQKSTCPLDLGSFWKIHELAGQKEMKWMQIAMEWMLVTLMARKETVNFKFDDVQNGWLFLIRAKNSKKSDSAFIKIKVSKEHTRLINEAKKLKLKMGIDSDYLIFARPKRKSPTQRASKPHWAAVTPDYFTKAFAKLRDELGLFSELESKDRPGTHEIRALGSRIYKKQFGYSEEYVQRLMCHADKKTTKKYTEGGREALTEDDFIPVDADLKIADIR